MAVLNQIEEIINAQAEGARVLLNQAAAFVIKTINVDHGEVGSFFLSVSATDGNGGAAVGIRVFAYRKTEAGVLTMITPSSDPLALTTTANMSGCAINATVNAQNHIEIRVTGTATPKNIKWQVMINPKNSIAFNYF